MVKTRILIVDDHPLFRDGLRALLQQQADFDLVGEADTADAAVRLALELRPDVVLLDLSLPDGDGVEVAQQILTQQPHIRVIVLTVHDDLEMLVALAKAGVHGYILKGIRAADLMRAVRTVVTTGAALSPEMLPGLLQQYRQLARGGDVRPILSPREQEIMRLIASGATNREIAGRLALSVQTIKNGLSIIYQKLCVSNRTEAVVAALERGLLAKEVGDG